MRRATAVLLPVLLVGCQESQSENVRAAAAAESAATAAAQATPAPAKDSKEWKIQDAASAAPPAISAQATVLDWPSEEGGEMPTLREGSNGWTCVPDLPSTPTDDPMCADDAFMQWAAALQGRVSPKLSHLGLAYMLQGASDASTTDPFVTEPAAGQDWVITPAHVMIAPVDPKSLDGMPTDPKSGGPYVMWKGTPYAHIMMPVK